MINGRPLKLQYIISDTKKVYILSGNVIVCWFIVPEGTPKNCLPPFGLLETPPWHMTIPGTVYYPVVGVSWICIVPIFFFGLIM